MSFANNFGGHQNVECGLICILTRAQQNQSNGRIKATPIPLQSVDVKASIIHAVAQVELTQVYVNKEEQPIEAVYYFPVDSNGGVTHFHAELEGKIIKGMVKPQEEAKAQYDKAVQEKTSAFLVESNKPDIFKVKVGYLKPGCLVKIVIGYVTEVKNEKGTNALRFFIPTTVSPRYIPPSDTDEKSLDLKNMKFSTTTPAPLTINVHAAIQGKFKSVECPSHKINFSQEPVPGKQTWNRAVVSLAGKTTDMDRDFVLNLVPEEPHVPRLYQETVDDSTTIMTHLIPSFKLDEQKVELIFVLDRSGSMQGQSIKLAKKALQLFLHSLPVDCYFNIVGFGSSYQFLFKSSVKYDDGNLKKALKLAETLDADLGGTELLEPLKKVFGCTPIDGYLRQVFVITDGEVSNTESVIGFVSTHAHQSRVFALGIGDGASHDLVEGLATAGGGTAAFASYSENIDPKVLQQLKNAIQPSLTNVSITWEGLNANPSPPPVEINKEKTLLGYGKPVNNSQDTPAATTAAAFLQVPEKIPPIFDGSQLLVFGTFSKNLPTGVFITAQTPDGPLSLRIDLNEENKLGSTGMLHSMAAIKAINDLQLKILRTSYEEGNGRGGEEDTAAVKALKEQVINISCKSGIVSKYTSFVAVDTNSQASDENWVMQTRMVPSQFTQGWHGGSGDVLFGSAEAFEPVETMIAMASYDGAMASYDGAMEQVVCYGSTATARRAPRTRITARKSTGGPAPRMQLAAAAARQSSIPICSRSRRSSSSGSETETSGAFGLGGFLGRGESCMGAGDEDMDVEEEKFEEYKPASKAEKEVAMTEQDRMHLLVKVQSFDGSFPLDEKFCSVIRLSLEILKGHAKTNGWTENSYATAVALCYFDEKFAAFKDSWELVALKGRKWLQKNAGTSMDAMITAAKECIKSIK